MKKLFLMFFICFIGLSFAQELQRVERVHGPLEYYILKFAKLSSLTVPPLYTTYKLLYCQPDTCPDPMKLGIAGVVWAATLIGVHKYDANHALLKEKTECTVAELTTLLTAIPELVDNLSVAKRNDYVYCPTSKIATSKLIFTIPELENMFGGYKTYYGWDANGKPGGELIIDEDEEPVRHLLITAWAKNQYDWKHWAG